MPMKDPQLPEGNAKQAFFDNLSKSNETVTWFTNDATPAQLTEYLLELLGLQMSQLRAFGTVGAEPKDESLIVSLITAPQGCTMTVWAQSTDGVQRVNRALNLEHERLVEGLGRGTYTGNAAQAYAVPLSFGQATDTSDWAELYAMFDAGAVVAFDDWE